MMTQREIHRAERAAKRLIRRSQNRCATLPPRPRLWDGSNLRDRHPDIFPVLHEWDRIADKVVLMPTKTVLTLRAQAARRARRG